jgi:prepilin-type N-terminal cleavage/methylation domain-containing protein
MDKKGFTLVELMVSLTVGMLVMLAVYGVMEMAQKSSTSVSNKVTTQQDVRSVLDLMAMEIRMASYNPMNTAATWGPSGTSWGVGGTAIPVCASMGLGTPIATLKGIQLSSRNAIIVAMDLDGSGGIGNAPNEYLMYSYDGVSTISRNVRCGGNDAILGGADTGTNVRNAAAGLFLFRYFDRLDNDITAALEASQSQIVNIRRILITIVADNEYADPGAATPRRMIYSTNVIVRNHVLSP